MEIAAANRFDANDRRSGPGTAAAPIFASEEVVRIADLKAADSRAAKLSPDEQREVRFALDSPLEGAGFETSVPRLR